MMFLSKCKGPVTTKTVMESLGIRNWSTVMKSLDKLEEGNLVTRSNVRVGKHASSAVVWKLEPEYGMRVVQALEQAELLMDEAANRKNPRGQDGTTFPESGRGITSR
jgi:hypothetical protein